MVLMGKFSTGVVWGEEDIDNFVKEVKILKVIGRINNCNYGKEEY